METNQARELAQQLYALLRLGDCVNLPNTTTAVMAEFLAAYGSSEYERGLREGLERAAKRVEENRGLSPDTKRPLAASIRQIK